MAYLTAEEFRTFAAGSALADTGNYPDALIDDAVAEFEEITESYLGYALNARERTWTSSRIGLDRWYRCNRTVGLPDLFVTEITAASNDGDTLGDLTTILLDSDAGIAQFPTFGVWTVTYTHGKATPPASIVAACRDYVKAVLLRNQSRVSRDVIAQSQDGATFRYSTPDAAADRPTGYTDVDRRLSSLKHANSGPYVG